MFYAIHVTGYAGDSGDIMNNPFDLNRVHNGRGFTTSDKGSERACCSYYGANTGFWYSSCMWFNANQPNGTLKVQNKSNSILVPVMRMMVKSN